MMLLEKGDEVIIFPIGQDPIRGTVASEYLDGEGIHLTVDLQLPSSEASNPSSDEEDDPEWWLNWPVI